MRNPQKLLLAMFSLAALIAGSFLLVPNPEPRYQGHPLSYWTGFYIHPSDAPERFSSDPRADEAVRHIGTNALPYLLRWFGSPLPAPRMAILKPLYEHLPEPARESPLIFTLYHKNADMDRPQWAFLGLLALAPQARPAVPALIQIRDNTNLFGFITSARAAYLLEVIADPARQDVPP